MTSRRRSSSAAMLRASLTGLLVVLLGASLAAPAGARPDDPRLVPTPGGTWVAPAGSGDASTAGDAADPTDDPVDPVDMADPAPPTDPGPASDPAEVATETLETVESIIAGTQGKGTAHQDLTIALRDLSLVRDDLPNRRLQARADRLLARPDGDQGTTTCSDVACYTAPAKKLCDSRTCVHYVTAETGSDNNNVPEEDDGSGGVYAGEPFNDVPDYVELVLAMMKKVRATYLEAGYRAVWKDYGRGGTSQFDVYLGQLHQDTGAYYGYCQSDDPRVLGNESSHVSTWAYCVLDNDYAPSEYGETNTPRENLEVTAAHEYFHAVQFAYDYGEDGWFMEATATWAEDELYDSINDNVYYLPYGPLGRPAVALDSFPNLHAYGAWIWFRFLTEKFPASAGDMPTLVRNMWVRASHNGAGKREYSLQAINNVLRSRDTTVAQQFESFSVINRRSRTWYDEGAAQRYPIAPLAGGILPTRTKPAIRLQVGLNHLSSRTYRAKPARGMGTGWRLRLDFDMSSTATGSAAYVTVHRASGAPIRHKIRLSASGNATKVVSFDRTAITSVEIALINKSTRYDCNRGLGWMSTCQGKPLDDGRQQVVNVRAYRS